MKVLRDVVVLAVAFFVILAFVLVLTGCGDMEAGEVTRKEYQPERTYFMMLPVQTGQICSGNPPTCVPIMGMFPFWIRDDEDWVLHLRDGDKTGKANVSQNTYDGLDVGEWYDKVPGDGKDEDRSVMSKQKPAEFE